MPKKNIKHRTASEIQKILSDQKVSGQSQKEFCKVNQIPISTFTNWVGKQHKVNQSSLPALIPVGSVPANTSLPIEIELPSGDLIRLEPGIRSEDLEVILGALRRC